MDHDDDPSILRAGEPGRPVEPSRPGRGRNALAALSGVGALVLMIVALVAGGGRSPAATSAAVGSAGDAAPDVTGLVTAMPAGPVPDVTNGAEPSATPCDPTSGAPTTLLCTTLPPQEPSTTDLAIGEAAPPPSSTLQPSTTSRLPRTTTSTSTTTTTTVDGDPTRPAGISVDVRLAGATFVAGQPVQATVRIRNATTQDFAVHVGCGVTWVELRDASGADITDRTGGEPCGTPGHYFNPSTVPAGGQLEKVLPLTVIPTAPAGPAQVHAAWARDTGAGLIHYIQAAPVPVQVAAPSAG